MKDISFRDYVASEFHDVSLSTLNHTCICVDTQNRPAAELTNAEASALETNGTVVSYLTGEGEV